MEGRDGRILTLTVITSIQAREAACLAGLTFSVGNERVLVVLWRAFIFASEVFTVPPEISGGGTGIDAFSPERCDGLQE